MSRSFIKSTTNQNTNLVSFLIKTLQPTLSTMIQVVKRERDEEMNPYIVKADLTTIPVMPKVEYFIYVQRFGPPPTGIFDEKALDIIRLEVGLIKELPNYYPIADGNYAPLPETDS